MKKNQRIKPPSLSHRFTDWKELEQYVFGLIRTVAKNLREDQISVFHNERLSGRSGGWQIDVGYRFWKFGVEHLVIVECKNLARKVTRREAAYFAACVDDLSPSRGVLVSNQPFTKGAYNIIANRPIMLMSIDEFFESLENDLTSALYKEAFSQIINMRDEAIFAVKFSFEGMHGEFFRCQRVLSQYVDFPERFMPPLSIQFYDLNGTTTDQHVDTRIEYFACVTENIKKIRREFGERVDLSPCEYTTEVCST